MKFKHMLLVAPIVLGGCYHAVNTGTGGVGESTTDESGAVMEDKAGAGDAMEKSGDAMVKADVEVTLGAKNFTFGQDVIRVKKGDRVKVTIDNTQGTHDFQIDEFGVNSGLVSAGSSKTVEFTADKTGSFEYFCGVGNHRQLGMKGTLIVE